ncbi:MAG: hypothetical protein HOP29_18200 [Phycisphaerales bacterium]|nr:hypothetical protein [Phycisphaerales bacterium]
MPFVKRKLPAKNPDHGKWVSKLAAECRKDTGNGPRIIEEQVPGSKQLHVYVIWDDWADAPDHERSAAILDAYKEAFDEETMLNVTIAMGLTTQEAAAMGIG